VREREREREKEREKKRAIGERVECICVSLKEI
jgi:hypothetical protein